MPFLCQNPHNSTRENVYVDISSTCKCVEVKSGQTLNSFGGAGLRAVSYEIKDSLADSQLDYSVASTAV
jgi:hypothetical protein